MKDGKSCNEPEQPQADSGEELAAQTTPEAQAAADVEVAAEPAVGRPLQRSTNESAEGSGSREPIPQGGDDTDAAAQTQPSEDLTELPTQLLQAPESGRLATSPGETAALAQRLEALESAVARLEEAVTALCPVHEVAAETLSILRDRGKFDKARELAIQKMHDELKLYRDQGMQNFKKEAIENLIVLYDHFQDCLAKAESEANAQGSLEFLREMLLETLYREDVEPMEDLPDQLDRKRHKVVRTVLTTDPQQDLTIHKVVRTGFTWHGQVLRPEHVEVWRHQPTEGAVPDQAVTASQAEEAQEATDADQE